MLAWAAVWKEKRRRETKQKHWPTKKRKQERKRTKHPVHSSQSVGEGGSVSSAFLCWSGHRQRWPSLRYSNLSFLQALCSPYHVISSVLPLDQPDQRCFQYLSSSLDAVSWGLRAVWHLSAVPLLRWDECQGALIPTGHPQAKTHLTLLQDECKHQT